MFFARISHFLQENSNRIDKFSSNYSLMNFHETYYLIVNQPETPIPKTNRPKDESSTYTQHFLHFDS